MFPSTQSLPPKYQHHPSQPLLQLQTSSFHLLHLFWGSFNPNFPHSLVFLQYCPFLPKLVSLEIEVTKGGCLIKYVPAHAGKGEGRRRGRGGRRHQVRRNDALGGVSKEKDVSINSHRQKNLPIPSIPQLSKAPHHSIPRLLVYIFN